MRALLSTKTSVGTPVHDHVLKMIDHLSMLKVLGAKIDGETQVDIILESLPESFNNFKLNYNMNKLNVSMAERTNSLQEADGIIKSQPSAHMAEKSSSSKSKPKGKGRKGRKKQDPKNLKVNQGSIRGVRKGKKRESPKPKGKCCHCGADEHWKRN